MSKVDQKPSNERFAKATGSASFVSLSASGVDLADCIYRIAEKQDESAFRELYENVAPSVKKYMMSRGANGATAEELAQEALTQVWLKAGSYQREKGNPTTWIFAIARNLRIDRIRKERVWQFSQELPDGHDEQPSSDPSPEEIVSEREQSAQVRAALAHLPQDQLEVITLSFIKGLSHSEIAAQLNLPLGTIKSRMRLAYDKIRPLLTGSE